MKKLSLYILILITALPIVAMDHIAQKEPAPLSQAEIQILRLRHLSAVEAMVQHTKAQEDSVREKWGQRTIEQDSIRRVTATEPIKVPIDNSLINAAERGSVEQVQALIAAGKPLDNKDERGYTALMRAICIGKRDIAQCLIAAGANIHLLSAEDETALMMAAHDGCSLEIVNSLISAGAQVNLQSKNGKTALMNAVDNIYKSQAKETIKALLAASADVNLIAPDGTTVFTVLTPQSQYKSMKEALELLTVKATQETINQQDTHYGWTALMHLVTCGGKVEEVAILLNAGADVKLRSKDGETALMLVKDNDPKVMHALMGAAKSESKIRDLSRQHGK